MALQALLPAPGIDLSSLVSRLSSLIFGYGPGSWAILAEPMTRYSGSIGPGYEIPMHCEPLQLLFEGGLIADALAGVWIWIHRRELVGTRAGAGVVAILVDSLWSFPFHVPTVAAGACVLMGLVTARINDGRQAMHEGRETRGRGTSPSRPSSIRPSSVVS